MKAGGSSICMEARARRFLIIVTGSVGTAWPRHRHAGQDEARFSAVIEAVSAVMMKIAYATISCRNLQPNWTNRDWDYFYANGPGRDAIDEDVNKDKLPKQIGTGGIASALATIKASTHHAKLMVRVHDRIVAEFPAGAEPVVNMTRGDFVVAYPTKVSDE